MVVFGKFLVEIFGKYKFVNWLEMRWNLKLKIECVGNISLNIERKLVKRMGFGKI